MKPIASSKYYLQQFGLLIISISLLLWLFARQNWQDILKQFQEVQYFWVIPILVVTLLNHFLRALRWRLLLATIAFEKDNRPDMHIMKVFRAVMIGYFVNLALPRVGEVARIWALQKHIAWQTLGTVITERLLDVLCLLLIILLFLSTNKPTLLLFYTPKYLHYLWIILPILFLLVFILVKLIRYFTKKQYIWWKNLRDGLQSLQRVRRQGWLWFYTGLLWWSYVAMSYYWFFALPATSHLGWEVAFGMLALGTLSRILPLQANSAGIYHSLVVWALGMYGVPEATAFALTLLIHTTQLLFTLFVGGLCWIWWIGQNQTTHKQITVV